ncbi:MAG TPA: NAD(P)-dependent oxidoreductase [Dongiaceae bacterium]|nr:NAD(P)-dependent oxidoreductase [Dongiaceae bacterium]
MVGSRILITGAAGLIGRAVGAALRQAGSDVVGLDISAEDPADRGDLCDTDALARRIKDVGGILHLGAVSRVIEGERDPDLCWRVNAEGTRSLLDLARQSPLRPWVIYASSREVYGQQDRLPVAEDARLLPTNVYARSKVEAERLTEAARAAGLNTAILRFSNVYGDTRDHVDRVVPAFARAAALAAHSPQDIRVDGAACTFDFTYLDDVTDGILRVVRQLERGEAKLPPIHFVTGQSTSLGELAALAARIGGPNVRVTETAPRSFDVYRFAGDPARAAQLLGWRARTLIEQGFGKLAAAYRADITEK